MSGPVKSSTEALESTRVALRNLAAGLAMQRGAVGRCIAPALDSLSDARARVCYRLESAEVELVACQSVEPEDGESPPDCSSLEDRVDELRDRLRSLDSCVARGQYLLNEASAAEHRAMQLVDAEVPEAIAFIRDRLGRLRYHQVSRLDTGSDTTSAYRSSSGNVPSGSGSGDPGSEHSTTTQIQPPSSLELLGTRLPAGFEWVPVSMLIKSSDYREEELHFKKASREMFCELYGRFRERIIPVMLAHGDGARGKLEEIDTSEKVFDGKNLRDAYRLFFESDPIVVNKTNNGITSGRHRIWAANELGWTHVPAKILR